MSGLVRGFSLRYYSSLSPAASFHLRSNRLDESKIKGTGKHGMITKADVLLALQTGSVNKLEKHSGVPGATSAVIRNRRMNAFDWKEGGIVAGNNSVQGMPASESKMYRNRRI